MKLALTAALLLAFSAPAVKADTVTGVTWTDTVTIYGNSEVLNGSFDWDVTDGVLSDIMTQQSGNLFNLSVLDEQNTAFVWNLYGAGEYTVEFLTEDDSLSPIGVLGDPGGNYYSQDLAVTLVAPMEDPSDPPDPPSDPPPVSTPEPSSVLLSGMGMLALMGLSFLRTER